MKTTCIMMAILVALITGCKSKDPALLNPDRVAETRMVIESSIDDSERRISMLGIIDSLEAQITDIGAEVRDLRQQVVEANRDYDTTREDLELLYAELGQRVEQITTAVKNHSLDLRGHCSASEWSKIADAKIETFRFNF